MDIPSFTIEVMKNILSSRVLFISLMVTYSYYGLGLFVRRCFCDVCQVHVIGDYACQVKANPAVVLLHSNLLYYSIIIYYRLLKVYLVIWKCRQNTGVMFGE